MSGVMHDVGPYSGLMPEPDPFLEAVCEVASQNAKTYIDFVPFQIDPEVVDKIMVETYAVISSNDVENAIEMVRADERKRIWSRADDPEVIHQLAGAIGGGGTNSMDSYNSDHISAAYRAREILLSIIIGPRPQGENDGQ